MQNGLFFTRLALCRLLFCRHQFLFHFHPSSALQLFMVISPPFNSLSFSFLHKHPRGGSVAPREEDEDHKKLFNFVQKQKNSSLNSKEQKKLANWVVWREGKLFAAFQFRLKSFCMLFCIPTHSFFCRFRKVIESPKPTKASSEMKLMLLERRSRWRRRCRGFNDSLGIWCKSLSPRRRYCRFSRKEEKGSQKCWREMFASFRRRGFGKWKKFSTSFSCHIRPRHLQ